MNLLRAALESPLVNRIGWTLLHFLWEAAVAAALLAIVLAILRRRSASARYVASCAGLLVLAALPVVTFWMVPARTVALAKVESSKALGSVANDGPSRAAPVTSVKAGVPAPSANGGFGAMNGAKPQAGNNRAPTLKGWANSQLTSRFQYILGRCPSHVCRGLLRR